MKTVIVQDSRDVTYWQGGGYPGTLRAYRAYHPAARVHIVTFRDRTVWMTGKQLEIWNAAKWYMHRHKNSRATLADIAARANCSRATASRFLRRLDLWRWLDYIAIVGRKGGAWLRRRLAPHRDAIAWLSGARITMATRKLARARMARALVRRLRLEADYLAALGNTGATFRVAS